MLARSGDDGLWMSALDQPIVVRRLQVWVIRWAVPWLFLIVMVGGRASDALAAPISWSKPIVVDKRFSVSDARVSPDGASVFRVQSDSYKAPELLSRSADGRTVYPLVKRAGEHVAALASDARGNAAAVISLNQFHSFEVVRGRIGGRFALAGTVQRLPGASSPAVATRMGPSREVLIAYSVQDGIGGTTGGQALLSLSSGAWRSVGSFESGWSPVAADIGPNGHLAVITERLGFSPDTAEYRLQRAAPGQILGNPEPVGITPGYVDLSAGPYLHAVQLRVGPRGEVLALMDSGGDYVDEAVHDYARTDVSLSYFAAGAAQGSTRVLNRRDSSGYGVALEIGRNRSFYASWSEDPPRNTRYLSGTLDQTLAPSRRLTRYPTYGPVMAVDSKGTAVISWSYSDSEPSAAPSIATVTHGQLAYSNPFNRPSETPLETLTAAGRDFIGSASSQPGVLAFSRVYYGFDKRR
jgi:hypothetical protein